ncbi:hypothetical protein BJ170DRAFT_598871 [Xylariales sp. AK1849]|nr:hypothetical protein BJ170DRAFT_598871 [Xylariales sp. AK1849]
MPRTLATFGGCASAQVSKAGVDHLWLDVRNEVSTSPVIEPMRFRPAHAADLVLIVGTKELPTVKRDERCCGEWIRRHSSSLQRYFIPQHTECHLGKTWRGRRRRR